MAIFKSNKTYIKKYASNNFDKKIKFAPNISADFGSGGSFVKPRSQENTATVVKTKPIETNEHYSNEEITKPYKTAELSKETQSEKISAPVAEQPRYKYDKIKFENKRRAREYDRESFSEGFSSFTTVIILLVAAALGVGVYFAYEHISQIREERRILEAELSVMYAPEEYIYPQTPPEIEAKVKAARAEAERIAAENAYVSKRAEVPGLFKSDYEKVCYLTFDDGPNPGVTESILDILSRYNVPATFFVVGKNVEANPNILKRIDAQGHSIGNHSYSHDYDYMYAGDEEFDDETSKCKTAINNALGREYKNLLYRFPGGSFEVYKHFYIYNIESLGYQYADWNAVTGDSETQTPDTQYIMDSLKKSTNNGTKEDIVVLMHDSASKQITADTLPQVIEYLKSKNYVFRAINNSNYVPQSAQ